MTLEPFAKAWTTHLTRNWQKYVAQIAKSDELDPMIATNRLSGTTPVAAAIAAPDTLAKVASSLAQLIDRSAAAEAVKHRERMPAGTSTLLDLSNAVECVGGVLSGATVATFRSWLPIIKVDRDDEFQHWYWNVGFAALALDEQITYRRFAGVAIDADLGFRPGALHGFNLQGVVRHLAGAVEGRAGVAAIEPAWREILTNYEIQRSAGTIHASTLLWIARIVYHRIGGRPLAAVARCLHDEVWG
jgi:hypothetical protein